MKKHFLLLLALAFTLSTYAQIIFEKGYIIDDSNEKIDCLIKNVDWNITPSKFEYKLTETSKIRTGTLENIEEFAVYNVSKYVRFKVNIDRSSDDVNTMSDKQNPLFNEEVLFLKSVIEGKAELYSYTDGAINRFFYRKDNSEIEQLVYKRFIISTDDSQYTGKKIGVNNTFKQQLWNNLKCKSITVSKAENLDYKERSLLQFFEDYNSCVNPDFVIAKTKEKRDFFNLNVRPGANFSSFEIEFLDFYQLYTYDLGSKVNFRLGLEAEFILGFNKNKWAIIFEPTFQSFKSEYNSESISIQIDYKSIEIPLGVRYYAFLNDKSKIFLNAQLCYDLEFNSTVENSTNFVLYVDSKPNFCFGLGYKYNDKFSLEARYFTPRGVIEADTSLMSVITTNWTSEYKVFSLILGYTLFE